MKRTITVFLDGVQPPIAQIFFEQQGRRHFANFKFTIDWLTHPQHYRIDPLLENNDYTQIPPHGSVFHSIITDAGPDGWAERVILRNHQKRRQAGHGDAVNPITPIDYLLAVDDSTRLGALRLQDESGVFQGHFAGDERRTPALIELTQLRRAARSVEDKTATADDLRYLLARGTSLGGMRPKCVVRDDDGHLALAKFPSIRDSRSIEKGEVLALRLARLAGITVPDARLIDSDGVPVAIIRRFDRRSDGSRIMYCSAATFLGLPPRDENDHSYQELAEAMQRHGGNVEADLTELWRRIAFSICVTNVDDHLHNHGFLHDPQSGWRLSPAFDINPDPDSIRELKTWITEDLGPSADLNNLRAAAPMFGIDSDQSETIIDDVQRAVAQWRDVGRELGMTDADLADYQPAFQIPSSPPPPKRQR